MNAQEAIEYAQVELDELKEQLEKHKRRLKDGNEFFQKYHKDQAAMLKKVCKQKSVILESAKFLHESLIKNVYQHTDGFGAIYGKEMIALEKEELSAIGIEVDDNAT